MERVEIVEVVGRSLLEGDDVAALACCVPGLVVYGEPELGGGPIANGLGDAKRALEHWRAHSQVELRVERAAEHGNGVVADVLIVEDGEDPDAWRLAVAVGFEHGLIFEIRAFWQRDAAERALAESL